MFAMRVGPLPYLLFGFTALAGCTSALLLKTSSSSPEGSGDKPGLTDQRLTGIGEASLSKGEWQCLRVAEAQARAEIAKQISVTITTRTTDRERERTNRPTEHDIEAVHEQRASEMLHDVRIVERTVDRSKGTCHCKAVMETDRGYRQE